MKKNECYEGIVRKLKFPNKGMVEVPGESAPVLVKKIKKWQAGGKADFGERSLRAGKSVPSLSSL